MRIDNIPPARLIDPAERPEAMAAVGAPKPSPLSSSAPPNESFARVLSRELQRVNEALVEADRQAQRVATGEAEDLQEAMIALAEADLALHVTLRVTQKAIAAYQEISRMQI